MAGELVKPAVGFVVFVGRLGGGRAGAFSDDAGRDLFRRRGFFGFWLILVLIAVFLGLARFRGGDAFQVFTLYTFGVVGTARRRFLSMSLPVMTHTP